MPVEFRSPSGLWLLSLLVPLVVLYILKVRRERVRVPSTWLWSSAARDLLARHPLQKLRLRLPLLFEMLALTLLALALALPGAESAIVPGSQVAIVLDTSASMAARDAAGKTRFSEAQSVTKRLLDSFAPGTNVLLVEAGREPRVISGLDRDRRRLSKAIERLAPREVEGNLGRALGLASDRLRQLPNSAGKRLFVITDGNLADGSALQDSVFPLDLIRVGTTLENSAIVRMDVRSGVDAKSRRPQVQVFASVVHYGTKPRDVFITLRQNNVSEPLASRRLRLTPGERTPCLLSFEPARNDAGTGLVVELSPGDALASDDHAYGRVPQGRSLPVVMLPAGSNPWVKRALLADPDVELLGAPLSALDGTAVPEDALLVIDGACPRALPSNDVLILNPPEGACEDVGVGRIVENASITSWAEADPRFRFLGLDGVQLAKARSVQTSGPNQALLHAGATTIASDISTPERTGTLLAFDVQDSNWPLKASFVLFLRNVVELSRAHRAHGALESARTGETLRLRVPADVSRVSLEQPGGTSVDVSARDGLAILPDTYRTGFYHASWQGKRPGSVLFATNLLSEAESDLRPHALRREGRELRASAGRDVPRGFSDLSWLFALLALSFMALDVWWLTRSQRRRLELAPDRAAMRLGMAARERARRSGA